MDTSHAPRWLVIAMLIAISLFGVLGCNREPHPRTAFVGLWESPDDYLLVVNRSRYPYFTSIAMLRHLDWRRGVEAAPLYAYDQLGRFTAKIYLKHNRQTGIDTLSIHSASGKQLILQRTRLRELAFLKSLGTYTQANYWLGVLYPDGIIRLLVLYLIITIMVSNFVSFDRLTKDPLVIFVVAVLLPIIPGYLLGVFKWIFGGWWDPLNAGRTMIYVSTVTLLIPLFALLDRIKHALRLAIPSQPARIVVFCLFLVCEAAALLVNIGTIYEWLN